MRFASENEPGVASVELDVVDVRDELEDRTIGLDRHQVVHQTHRVHDRASDRTEVEMAARRNHAVLGEAVFPGPTIAA